MPYEEVVECPLCMEPLDIDDLNFYPCTCGYQICRFCWHRIRTDENSLCPACRKQYQEDPAQFKPLTEEDLTKIKKERRQKDMARKQKAAENRRHLANIRVVQKNLVFVVGLSNRLADADFLKRHEYFGKYGKIMKVVINASTSYAGAQGPSASAYITYSRPEDCLKAIQAVNNLYVDGRTLKASLGTTKYCSHFLKGTTCAKTDCMYLHELGEDEASFTKEEMQAGKHQDYELKLIELYLSPANIGASAITSRPSTTISSSSVQTTTISTAPSNENLTAIPPEAPPSKSCARKKTDSGSSGGSNKAKEPWPLLNSNKNSNHSNGLDSDSLISASLDSLTAIVPNHRGSPDSNRTRKHSDLAHSPPSSSSRSSSSNPRTPTPETNFSVSPHLPNTGTTEINTVPVLTTHPPPGLKHVALTGDTTMLAARKLPFTEALDQSSNGDYFMQSTKDILLSSSCPSNGLDSLKFTGLSKEVDAVAKNGLCSEWAINSDDELGFDPFTESNKALADMLENESGHNVSPISSFLSSVMRQPPPGVTYSPHLAALNPGLHSDGIMSSVVPSVMPVVTSSSSLPPPPPGLSGFSQFSNSSLSQSSPDLTSLRGSRILGLMNLGQGHHQAQPGMVLSSPINNMPSRGLFNDPRMNSMHQLNQNSHSFNGIHNGMSDSGSYSTHELKESLKAVLPFASINIAPGFSGMQTQQQTLQQTQQQTLQQSRLRSSYMPQNSSQLNQLNHSMSWNGVSHAAYTPPDDQFLDPAIVSGCLSSDLSSSPPGSQPHWLKSIQQLTETDPPQPIKMSSINHQMQNNMHGPGSMMGFRSTSTHSRMPFAQMTHINQSANNSGWPTFQTHNPPPGFQSAFRSTTQNPRMTTQES